MDHLTIVAETPFTTEEVRALDRLQLRRRVSHQAPPAPVQLLLLGMASLDDLDYCPLPLKRSRNWISATPFLAPRHPKRRGQNRDSQERLASPAAFLEAALREELDRLAARREAAPRVEAIRPLLEHNAFRLQPRDWAERAGGRTLRPLQFKRFREKRGDDGGRRPAGAFEIVFASEIRGPICLGHSAHFGLGLFLPAAEGGE